MKLFSDKDKFVRFLICSFVISSIFAVVLYFGIMRFFVTEFEGLTKEAMKERKLQEQLSRIDSLRKKTQEYYGITSSKSIEEQIAELDKKREEVGFQSLSQKEINEQLEVLHKLRYDN